jgi:hypothetical protein
MFSQHVRIFQYKMVTHERISQHKKISSKILSQEGYCSTKWSLRKDVPAQNTLSERLHIPA